MEENHPRPRMPEEAAQGLTIEFTPGRPGIGGLLQFGQLPLEAARGLSGRLAQALQPLELSDLLGLKVWILRHTGNITADFDDVVLQQAQAFACLKLSKTLPKHVADPIPVRWIPEMQYGVVTDGERR